MTAGHQATGGAARAPRHWIGYLWAAITVLIFSGWFVVTRVAVTHALTVWDVTILRFGIGAVLLSPAVLRPGGRLPLKAWGEGFVFSLLWGTPFVLLVAVGLKLTSAAEAAAITPTLMPVCAGLLGWLVLREFPGGIRLAGYAAIIAGQILLTFWGLAGHGLPDPLGILALAGASAVWAAYTLLFRSSRLSPIQAAALICIWSTILYLPIYIGAGLSRIPEASLHEIAFQALYQGVLMSCVAIVTFNRAVTLLGPNAAAAIIALVPGSAAVMGAIFLGEIPTPLEWIALAVIFLGVLLASKVRLRRARGI